MDKYEYKVRADEIKALIAQGQYAEAAKVADSIDWRRVKSVMMLCTISDLYKINRRFEESKEILLLAYDRHPGGRLIVYSLCELSIKLEEYVQAIEYYKEFVQIAPKDSGRFILQYKLYEAQEVSLEERIEVLEELKKKDYREKWAYELAYLYHRVGFSTKCVEECDEIFLWFGDGRYVMKALELKELHTPLTQNQSEKYIQFKNNINGYEQEYQTSVEEEETADEEEEETEYARAGEVDIDEEDIQVKPPDISQYNTINLQKVLADGMKEVLEAAQDAELSSGSEKDDLDTSKIAAMFEDTDEIKMIAGEAVEIPQPKPQINQAVSQEVYFGDTAEVQPAQIVQKAVEKAAESVKNSTKISNTGIIKTFIKPSGYDDMLSQEYDGQISLVMPDSDKLEKQITGQISITDVMQEWERMKKENEQKRMEAVRQKVQKQTDVLLADFDESTKSGLLEKLEKVMVEAVIKEEKERSLLDRPRVVKLSDSELEKPDINFESIHTDKVEPVEEIQENEAATAPAVEDLAAVDEMPEEEEQPAEAEKAVEESGEAATEEEPKAEPEPESVLKQPDSEKYHKRELSNAEKEQFGRFLNHKKARKQIAEAIDNISMASYTGNVMITGDPLAGTIDLAKLLLKNVQASDSNFSGKVAKVSGTTFNKKNIKSMLDKLPNGALIIEGAAAMKKETLETLIKELDRENRGLIVILEEQKALLNQYIEKYPAATKIFNLRIDVEALDDQALVAHAKEYAKEMEFSIDDLGILALHTRIAEMQTSDHEVTVAEVEEIIDEAIYYAERKTPGHFFDILLSKRYDEEDMIILREKDFINY